MLFEIFGLGSYLPYVLPASWCTSCSCAVLYLPARAAGRDVGSACAALARARLFGAGSEAFLVEAPVALTRRRPARTSIAVRARRARLSRRSLAVGVLLLVGGHDVHRRRRGGRCASVVFAARRGGPAAVAGRRPAPRSTSSGTRVGRDARRGRLHGDDLSASRRRRVVLIAPFGDVVAVPGSARGPDRRWSSVASSPGGAARPARRRAGRAVAAAGARPSSAPSPSCTSAWAQVLTGRYQLRRAGYLLPAAGHVALREAGPPGRAGAARPGAHVAAPVLVVARALGVVPGQRAAATARDLATTRARPARGPDDRRGRGAALGERMLDPDRAGSRQRGRHRAPSAHVAAPLGGAAADARAAAGRRVGASSSAVTPKTTGSAPARLDSTRSPEPLQAELGCQVVHGGDRHSADLDAAASRGQVAVESASTDASPWSSPVTARSAARSPGR